MIGNNIDLVIIPPSTSKVFKVRLPISTIFVLLVSLCLLFLFTAFVFAKYVENLANQDRYHTLQKTLNSQKLSIKGLQNDLESYNKKLTEFKNFESKIRIIIGEKDSIETQSADYEFSSDFQSIPTGDKNDVLIQNSIVGLDIGTKRVANGFLNLESIIHQNLDKLARTPSIIPLREGHLTSRFGMRNDPFTGKPRMHTGIDWAYLPYTPIISPADGVVENIIKSFSYGNLLVIDHGYGLKTRYAHLAKLDVKKGEAVKRGQIIARMGGTGARSTAVHLHYEIKKNNDFVNPENFLLDGPVIGK